MVASIASPRASPSAHDTANRSHAPLTRQNAKPLRESFVDMVLNLAKGEADGEGRPFQQRRQHLRELLLIPFKGAGR